MIDRKAFLGCAALVGLMLVAAIGRMATLDDWTIPPIRHDGASLPALVLLAFPAASALVAAALYWNGLGMTEEAKARPWHRWGTALSIFYCTGMLLMQSLVIVRSLDLDLPFDLAALARAGGLCLALVALLAINRLPKLPWVERVFALKVGGPLGPVYGPRYLRIQSRAVVVFMIVVIIWSVSVPPAVAERSVVYILLACALLVAWSIVLRFHLSRKWRLEQRDTG